MNAEQRLCLYLDSSAIVKLVVREPESAALQQRLIGSQHHLTSSTLAYVEVHRAVRHHGAAAREFASEVLSTVDLIAVSSGILSLATKLEPADMRSLDAIHLATTTRLADTVDAFICYDHRLASATHQKGFTVENPKHLLRQP